MDFKTTKEQAKLFCIKESPLHGKGLFAVKDIKAGTYLGCYEGRTTKHNGMHVLWVEEEDGKWIGRDGTNALRFLNHSRKPCAEFDGYDLYAIKKIRAKEEITFDYGEDP